MTDDNNLNDLDHEMHHEGDEAPRTGLRANLTNAWRTQPLIKLLALMVVVAAVVGISLSLFSGTSAPAHKNDTALGVPPALHEAPGGKASEYVRDQTQEANLQRQQMAIKEGTSNIPTPIGNDDINRDEQLNQISKRMDDMQRDLVKQKTQPQQVQAQPNQQPEQFDDSLAKAMQKQMGDLVTSWSPKGVKNVAVSKGVADGSDVQQQQLDQQKAASEASAAETPTRVPRILIPAGTVSYAKLLTEANSDVPGPILAQVVSGPLNGARVVGSFVVENAYADYLVLRFTLAELKGKEYQINTLALDPDTSLGGMATEVDERYFERVLLPAAAAFAQGVGQTLGQNSYSVVDSNNATIVTETNQGLKQGLYQGLGAAANSVGTFFQNQANNTKPLIRVAAGTPMGLMFVTSVKDEPSTQGQGLRGSQPSPLGLAGYSAPDASQLQGAYPGTTIPGYGQPNAGQLYPQQGQQTNLYNTGGYGNGYSNGYNANPFGGGTGFGQNVINLGANGGYNYGH